MIRFEYVNYGTNRCSCGCGKVLGNSSALNIRKCWVIADEADDDGQEWRMFTPECFAQIEHMSDEDIYRIYSAAEFV